jgi:glycosyltransferase involved in cell wall biosynthesis
MLTRAFAAAADKATRGRTFQVVQAHDNYALLAASRLARRDRARLIYDAVELTEHRLATNFTRLERLAEWYDRRQEAAIFRRADAVTTIGKGVAHWYTRQYRIAPPLVIRNCRYYWPYRADARLRTDIGVGAEVPLVVWFGGIYPQQGVELLIDAVPLFAPNVHLAIIAFVLPRWRGYFNDELPRRAADRGVAERVHFLPDRPPEDLVAYVSGADLGVIPRPSEHLNNFYSMPNKFLEMIMARLPIAVSRLGDIVDVVEEYGIGASFDQTSLDDMARVIGRMLDPQMNRRLKANLMKAAKEMNWELESLPYVALVRTLTRDAAQADSVAS